MTDIRQQPESVSSTVADSVGKVASEVEAGRSWRTPLFALAGTALMVAAAVILIAALAFAAHSLAQ
jgi:cell division protein FtsX